MHVKDVMTKQPFYLDADVSIQEVSQTMRDKNLGFVPLSKDNRVIGVITDRDIALRVVADSKDPHQKPEILRPNGFYIPMKTNLLMKL